MTRSRLVPSAKERNPSVSSATKAVKKTRADRFIGPTTDAPSRKSPFVLTDSTNRCESKCIDRALTRSETTLSHRDFPMGEGWGEGAFAFATIDSPRSGQFSSIMVGTGAFRFTTQGKPGQPQTGIMDCGDMSPPFLQRNE